MQSTARITEADILEQLIVPTKADLPIEAAHALLALKFNAATLRTIRRLLRMNNAGNIAVEGRLQLEKYLRVGQMLDLLHAKARVSLHKNHIRN